MSYLDEIAKVDGSPIQLRAVKAELLLEKAADFLGATISDLLHSICVVRDGVPDETTMEPDDADLIAKMRADHAEIEAFLHEPDEKPDGEAAP